MFFSLRENIVNVAAPKPHAIPKRGIVSGYPVFSAPDTLARQKQGRRRLFNCLDDCSFFTPFKITGITSDNAKPGKSLPYIFFGFKKNFVFSPEKVTRKFTVFQK